MWQKLDAEKELLKLKYSSETARDDTRLVENIESVKEVALTCERKIKEFKVHNCKLSSLLPKKPLDVMEIVMTIIILLIRLFLMTQHKSWKWEF